MDPSGMTNDGAFQTSRYNFTEIWSFPINGGGPEGGLDTRRLQFGQSLGQFAENASVNRDVSRNDRTVLDKGKSQSATPKKQRGQAPEDEPSKAVSTNKDTDDCDGKHIKMGGSTDENLDSNAINSSNAAEKDTKPPEPPKQDYIHVRARRGQATDSHSLAERARREKISERMKILQDLVPGCSKVIGKALVLDEIINYIQSLQRQVEFLSMKLEAVNSRVDPSPQRFPAKDIANLLECASV